VIPAIASLLLLTRFGSLAQTSSDASLQAYFEDFDAMWSQLRADYGYFDYGYVDWQKARDAYRPKIASVRNRGDFILLLEGVLDQLADHHTQLNTNTPASQRLVPSGANVWSAFKDSKAWILEVRPWARTQARAGEEVLEIDGISVREAVDRRIGVASDARKPSVRDYALQCLLAGHHNADVRIKVRSGGKIRSFVVAPPDRPEGRAETAPVYWKWLSGRVGYIRFQDKLYDTATIGEFDRALSNLKSSRALVMDLRDTPSGGNTTVARAVIGRFLALESGYQKHSDPAEERETGVHRSWIELASPRGAFQYRKRLIVLIDHWTASMGEGLAIGLASAAHATTVGTPMAGLLGAKRSYKLPHTGIEVSYAAEKLFTVSGLPRERYRPNIEVDPAVARSTDPILDAALRLLKPTS
jgi:C-terminal processing protease CtpA/Prc